MHIREYLHNPHSGRHCSHKENEEAIQIWTIPYYLVRKVRQECVCQSLSFVSTNKNGNKTVHAFACLYRDYLWKWNNFVLQRRTRWTLCPGSKGHVLTEQMALSSNSPKHPDLLLLEEPQIKRRENSQYPHLPIRKFTLVFNQPCEFFICLHICTCSHSKIIF